MADNYSQGITFLPHSVEPFLSNVV